MDKISNQSLLENTLLTICLISGVSCFYTTNYLWHIGLYEPLMFSLLAIWFVCVVIYIARVKPKKLGQWLLLLISLLMHHGPLEMIILPMFFTISGFV